MKERLPIRILSAAAALFLLAGAVPCRGAGGYRTFADYPGFAEHFAGTCRGGSGEPPPEGEKSLLGRDGPPGSDFSSIPPLLPLGKLLKFACLQDGGDEDVAVVRESVDEGRDSINIDRIVEHGGRTFYRDWRKLTGGEGP